MDFQVHGYQLAIDIRRVLENCHKNIFSNVLLEVNNIVFLVVMSYCSLQISNVSHVYYCYLFLRGYLRKKEYNVVYKVNG